MNCIKFDGEKAKRCIDAYYDQHGSYPYLIMSSKTYDTIPLEKPGIILDSNSLTVSSSIFNTNVNVAPVDKIKVGDNTYILKQDPVYKKWYNAKILFDEELKYGEVHIG